MSMATPNALTPETVAAVQDLARRCQHTDAADPLSEAFELALTSSSVTHVTYAEPGNAAAIIGYGQRDTSGSAELFVDPAHRRQGIGAALLKILSEQGPVRVWAHGDLPAAQAIAASGGYAAARSLHRMERPVGVEEIAEVPAPAGLVISSFAEHPDVVALQRINAAAFAHHPEQGRLTVDDLNERMRQPWFDPEGLILLVDPQATDGSTWAAYHWTKREPGSPTGEVYVVGVAPAYQGRGLARPLTELGLRHLAQGGITTVELYVDGDNTPALRTYERTGFTIVATDVMYAPVR